MKDIEKIQSIEDYLGIIKDNILNKYLKKEERKEKNNEKNSMKNSDNQDNNQIIINKIESKKSNEDCLIKIQNILDSFDYNHIKATNEQILLKEKLENKFEENNNKILNYISEFSNLKDLLENNIN